MEGKQFRSFFAENRCQTRPVDDDIAEPATKDYINCLEDEEETTSCRNLVYFESHVKCEVSSNVYTFITSVGRLKQYNLNLFQLNFPLGQNRR